MNGSTTAPASQASKNAFLGAYLGRNQGPELFFSQPFTAGTVTQIPKTLSINRPLEALILQWRGRVVIGVANYAAVAAEAPQTIIDKIRIYGTYKGSALTPWQISGATAFAYGRCFNQRGSSLYINGTRQNELSVPLAQLGATFGNTGTYDLEINYVLPCWPQVGKSSRAQSIVPFCWQPADWNDTLQIELTFGDNTSFGTPGAMGTTTFTAFGSGAGSPTVNIFTRYLILGPLRTGFNSACVLRNEQQITQGVTALGNNIRLAVLQKQKTTNVLFKTGVNLTGTSAFAHVFASLADNILDVTNIQVDNKFIRNNFSNPAAKEHAGLQFDTVLPGGYGLFSFVDGQNPRSAFRADLPTVVGPGSSFELDTNVISANANNLVNVIQEQIYADANDPFWQNTR